MKVHTHVIIVLSFGVCTYSMYVYSYIHMHICILFNPGMYVCMFVYKYVHAYMDMCVFSMYVQVCRTIPGYLRLAFSEPVPEKE